MGTIDTVILKLNQEALGKAHLLFQSILQSPTLEIGNFY